MPELFSYKSKNNKVYYLHKKGNLYYFSTKKEGAISLPKDRFVVENPINNLPILKRKR